MNTKVIYNRALALTVTLVLVTTFALGGGIQKKTIKRIAPQRTITGEEVFAESPNQGIGYPSTYTISPGDSIDRSSYDLGSNASANKNFVNFGTTVALARMIAHDLSAGTLDRDSWTACSTNGGVTWPTLTKVEALRRGWTNIFNNNGIAGTVSHTGLEVNRDAANCMHSWTASIGTTGYLWPRITTTGTTNVHVICADANPPVNLLYLRSTDNGATFSYPGVAIATPSTWVANADIYDIASSGTNVAVIVAQLTGDIKLIQSTNEGLTWSTSTIYDVDETFMTAEDVPDGTCAAVYDNSGNLHVVWAAYFANGGGPDSIFYSVGTGIHHWSLATGDQLIGLPPSDAGVPDRPDPEGATRNGAIANQPDIAVDADNNLYVVYQSWISELDVLGYNQEHIFGVASSDAGTTWDPEVDLTPGTGFSASFPSIPDNVSTDNIVHMAYFSDPYSGSWVYDNLFPPPIHPHINVAVKHYGILKGNFFTLDCADISSMAARCVGGGTKTVQARVNLLNSTVFVGRTVTVTIDEDSYIGSIITNGIHSRANFSISGVYTTGDHVVTLVSPACLTPKHALCATSDELAKADPEWSDDWSDLDAQSKVQVPAGIPAKTTLLGNYPNPFNPSTTISYGITTDARVSLKVYNTLGEEVATLVNEFQSAGFKSVVWNGKNSAGSPVASGIYIYRLTAGNVVKTQKMMFMK